MPADKSTPVNPALPPVIFGTSSLGNLFVALDDSIKKEIIEQCITLLPGNVIFDSAGKYGAGLALETLGKHLNAMNADPSRVIVSNKLGWFRTQLKTPEPTFEPGVWRDLKHDAVQKISYHGILECFNQGNELLAGYTPGMVSVHDPDEYIATGRTPAERDKLFNDILAAYQALNELKARGEVRSVGVGAKDWHSIERIARHVRLDWVMIANSMTIKTHPEELLDFMESLEQQNVQIINSAVFHSGFLIGGDYFDYRHVDAAIPGNEALFNWRAGFFEVCKKFGVKPAEACVQFALKAPGVKSIALSTTNPKRVKENINMAKAVIPAGFWAEMADRNLLGKRIIDRFIH